MQILSNRNSCIALMLAFLGSGANRESWTWVLGTQVAPGERGRYETYCQRIFDYYQGRGLLVGELLSEQALAGAPEGNTVYLGPLDAFAQREWLAPHVPLGATTPITFHGVELTNPNTGLFLRSEDSRTYIYTGLSMEGFESIFTKPTGASACTILVNREVAFEGDYEDGRLNLEARGFLRPYPLADELADLADADKDLRTKPVYDSKQPRALSADFKDELSVLTRDQRVLFVGETHWNVGVNQLFQGVLEHLLDGGRVRAVFFEMNYSFSGFWNHYVHIASDQSASEFREGPMHDLVNAESTMRLLESLRLWNRAHPDAQVDVACTDMEWSHDLVMLEIVAPYMRFFDPEFAMGPASGKTFQGLLDEIDAQLATFAAENAPGPYPFQTPGSMQRVMTNLRDTLAIADRNVDRQRGILRNVTEFHGELLDRGLVVFKGGGWHAVKDANDSGFQREAAFLEHDFEATRGKVKTLMLNGLGVGFDAVAGMDLQRIQANATNYRNFVDGFQRGLASGQLALGGHYFLNDSPLTHLDKRVMRRGYETQCDVLWIDPGVEGEQTEGASFPYDAMVYVLRSQLEPTRLMR